MTGVDTVRAIQFPPFFTAAAAPAITISPPNTFLSIAASTSDARIEPRTAQTAPGTARDSILRKSSLRFFRLTTIAGSAEVEEKQKIYALSLKLGHFSCKGEINDEQSSSADSHPGEGGGEECRGDIGKEHGVTSSGGGTALKAPCR